MKSNRYACDNCGKEARDHPYDKKTHWMTINGTIKGIKTELRFCSLACSAIYIKRIRQNAELQKGGDARESESSFKLLM